MSQEVREAAMPETLVAESQLSSPPPADRTELTCTSLSAEAERLRDWFGLPIRRMPASRGGDRQELREFILTINELIAGNDFGPSVRQLINDHLPADKAQRFHDLFRVGYEPLWNREELAELARRPPGELGEVWRQRVASSSYWSEPATTVRPDLDFEEVWGGLPVGDFDVSGRGKDYTLGMQYFQAARAFGIESLMDLFPKPSDGRDPVYLDVLGGDGYILRIFEASRRIRAKRLLLVDAAPEVLGEAGAVRPDLQAALSALTGGALVLLRSELPHGRCAARLIGIAEGDVSMSAPFELTAREQEVLRLEPSAARLASGTPARSMEEVLGRVRAFLTEVVEDRRRPRVITNDLSPHMFYSAGLWGLPVREDARCLGRTFLPNRLDGVLFAYGTHHITGLDEGIAACHTILRPGGRIVVHDFLDEGQVGRWFHDVVDKRSRTGHDFPHLSPVQLAVYLFLAGFRDIELFEMEDPFIFAVPHDSGLDARDVACTYLLGMYGMTESFHGQQDLFEETVERILSYPEINNTPLFARDLVYVPRRALVASAQRPVLGSPPGLSPHDAALATVVSELLGTAPGELVERYRIPEEIASLWFPQDGKMWGLTEQDRRLWLEWYAGAADRAAAT